MDYKIKIAILIFVSIASVLLWNFLYVESLLNNDVMPGILLQEDEKMFVISIVILFFLIQSYINLYLKFGKKNPGNKKY